MSRATMIRLGLLLTALLLPVAAAEAGGGRAGAHADAPKASNFLTATSPTATSIHQRVSHAAAVRHPVLQHPGIRHSDRRFGGEPRWRRSGRGLFTSAGYLGPWTYPAGAGGGQTVSTDGDASPGWVDRNAFETMPVRLGIMRSPTPEPTIYRLEGRRDRPATRVIRISEAEPRGAKRSRFAHAETGALLLVVPGR